MNPVLKNDIASEASSKGAMSFSSNRMKEYALPTLRVGLALVFIWFGLTQIANVSDWVGWLPGYASALPISPEALVYINGTFELFFGLLLLVGFYIRLSASLLALHMVHILSVVGYGEIWVRDFALFVGVLTLAFYGQQNFSLDAFFKNKQQA